MDATVECRSEAAYAERPVAFIWQGERREVIEILKHWRAPQGIGFRVSTREESVFDLLYNEALDVWSIQEL